MIWRAGEPVKVQPKVFDLLVFLIENRDRAMGKAEIQDAIWPNQVVTETALTRAVMKARKAVQDSGSWIKTVHGHGYHFVADVQSLAPEAASVGASGTEVAAKRTPRLVPLLGCLVLLALVALGLVQWWGKASVEVGLRVAVLPVSVDPVNDDLSWAPLGLMSLATRMIQGESTATAVSARKMARLEPPPVTDEISLSSSALRDIQDEFGASHVIVTALKQSGPQAYLLSHVIYHPGGVSPVQQRQGDNPTALMQDLVKGFNASLPGAGKNLSSRVVSQDVFTNELYARGMVHQLRGDAKRAREYFALTIEEDPTLFWPRYELALTSRQLKAPAEAEREFRDLLALRPQLTGDPITEAAARVALGSVLSRKGDEAAAIESFQRAATVATEQQRIDVAAVAYANMALSYKRRGEYDQARHWLAQWKSLVDEEGLPDDGQLTYQMAQIERDTGNIVRALALFDQALARYRRFDKQSHMAAALSSMSRILGRQGKWAKAHRMLDESIQMRESLTDRLGLVDGYLSRIEILIEEGRFSEAAHWIDVAAPLVDQVQVASRAHYLQRMRVLLHHYRGDQQQVQHLLDEAHPRVFNSVVRGIQLTTDYNDGKPDDLHAWLAEYRANENKMSHHKQLLYWDLQAYLSALAQDGKQLDHLQQRIDLAHRLGFYAVAAKTHIRVAQRQIRSQDWLALERTLGQLSLLDLDWWSVDLLRARLADANNDAALARELAARAKERSTELWSEADEAFYQRLFRPSAAHQLQPRSSALG